MCMRETVACSGLGKCQDALKLHTRRFSYFISVAAQLSWDNIFLFLKNVVLMKLRFRNCQA
jgi:hypothetical protein